MIGFAGNVVGGQVTFNALLAGQLPVWRAEHPHCSGVVFGDLFLPSGELLTAARFEDHFASPFLANPEEFLRQCEGAFVCAVHDHTTGTLHLATDPFGNLALHYAKHGDTLSFATNGRMLAEAVGPATRDELGVMQYVGFGQALCGRTLWTDVRRLDVATLLRFSAGRIATHRYATPSFRTQPASERPHILTRITERIVRNVQIRTATGEACESGLSGGFDSRVVLAALSHVGARNTTLFTLGMPGCGDIRIATQLAGQVGFPHVVFPYDGEFLRHLPDYWSATVRESEGGLGIESSPQFATWMIRHAPGRRHMDGHGGPIFRRQILKAVHQQAKRYPSLAQFIFAKMASPLMQGNVLRADAHAAAEAATRAALEEYFGTLPSRLPRGDQIDRFYIDQQCGHHYSLTGNLEMQHSGLSHPLLSFAVWELLSQLSGPYRASNGVHRAIIHRLAPALERYPLDNSGFRVPYRGYRALRYVAHGSERLLRLATQRVVPALGGRLSLRRPPFSGAMVASADPERLRAIAMQRSVVDEYFHRDAIEALPAWHPALMAVANVKTLLAD